jgi:hypothetical protein
MRRSPRPRSPQPFRGRASGGRGLDNLRYLAEQEALRKAEIARQEAEAAEQQRQAEAACQAAEAERRRVPPGPPSLGEVVGAARNRNSGFLFNS